MAGRSGPRARGRPTRASGNALAREEILRRAIALVDRRGIEGLTMRRLAGDLGVTPMALYNHFRDKSALLDGVADLVAREFAVPDPALPWSERVRACMVGVRRACLAHPNAVPLIQTTRATTPALLRPFETTLAALGEAGLGATHAFQGASALVALTMGHVTYQLGGHAAELDFDRAFEFALDSLIAGLATAAPS